MTLFSVTVCHPHWAMPLLSDRKQPESCEGDRDPLHPHSSPLSPVGVRSGPAGPAASLGLSAMTGPALLLLSIFYNATTSQVSLRIESFHYRLVANVS